MPSPNPNPFPFLSETFERLAVANKLKESCLKLNYETLLSDYYGDFKAICINYSYSKLYSRSYCLKKAICLIDHTTKSRGLLRGPLNYSRRFTKSFSLKRPSVDALYCQKYPDTVLDPQMNFSDLQSHS